MSVKLYQKLVRDRIPEIIEASGKSCVTEILSDADYLELLDAKLDEELAEYYKDQCKYRPRCPTCTVFRSHQNGEGAPPSRKGDPPASRDSRREFSTAIAARSAGDASSSTVVNCRRDRKPRVSEPTRSSFSFPPPLPPSSRAAHA